MKSFLVQRWLRSLAALSIGGLMIAAPALGQGSKSEAPKSPAAQAEKDKAPKPEKAKEDKAPKEEPKSEAPATPSNNPKNDGDKSPPATPPSGTTPASPADAGNSAGNSGSDKETPRRPDSSPATPATPGNTNAKENQPARDTRPDSARDTTNPNRTPDATNRDTTNPNRTPDATKRDATTPNRNDRDSARDANTDPNRPRTNDANTTRDNDRRDTDRRDARTDRRDNVNVSTKVRNQAFSTLGLQVGAATQGNGLAISTVQANSVFHTAGFRNNDVIVRVGDRRFNDDVVFYNWLATVRPNQRVAIVVLRDGQEQTINWTPTEQWIEEYTTVTKEVALPANAGALGIYLDPQVQDAALVADVEPNSAAHKAGVQRNDYIDAVNGERVRSPQDFQALTANVQANAITELTVSRQMKVQLGATGGQSSSTTTTVERRDTRINTAPATPAPPSAVPAPPQPATGPAVVPGRPGTPAVPPRGENRPGILPRSR